MDDGTPEDGELVLKNSPSLKHVKQSEEGRSRRSILPWHRKNRFLKIQKLRNSQFFGFLSKILLVLGQSPKTEENSSTIKRLPAEAKRSTKVFPTPRKKTTRPMQMTTMSRYPAVARPWRLGIWR